MNKSISLTQGSIARNMFFFSLPLMFSNLLQMLFNMADVMVAGRFAGPEALGAVGSTSTIATLFTTFLIGIGNGVNVIAAKDFGAKDEKGVSVTANTSFIICTVVGFLTTALGIVFARPILVLMGTKPELLEGAVIYLKIYFLGMPALGLYNYGTSICSAYGDTKKPLFYMSISGVVNVILNLIFVIAFNLSVVGVASASVVSQCLSAALLLRWVHKCDQYGFTPRHISIDGGKCRSILTIGLWSGLQNSIFSIANSVILSAINTFDASIVEGNAAATNAGSLIFNLMCAFYTASSSFIGQNYGAGNKERILKSYYWSLFYSVMTATIFGLSFYVFGRQFIGLFTTDPAIIEGGMIRIKIMNLPNFLAPLMDCTMSASRGLGKTFWPTVFVLLGSCVFRIFWIFTIFPMIGTIESVYIVFPISWIITAALEMVYFAKIYRDAARTLEKHAA